MLHISCSGSPREIGLKHGQEAREAVLRSIDFYTERFQESAKMSWDQVKELADQFEPVIRKKWPAYLEEMAGVAEGARVSLSDIIAINVRTEITFGLFSDGCTALSWTTPSTSLLAQNWDWQEAQKANIVHLTIAQPGHPTIAMLTEAGLIGKIGLNDAGVGVCLNAIRARGLDPTRLPCHLGLRMVLESRSRDEAVRRLEKHGVASACHMLVAEGGGGVGLEWSAVDVRKLPANAAGQVFHANHFLLPHAGVEDSKWLADSSFRTTRIEELCKKIEGEPDVARVQAVFRDEANYPGSICRAELAPSTTATLFNIVMDLRAKTAEVVMGRPTEPDETFQLTF